MIKSHKIVLKQKYIMQQHYLHINAIKNDNKITLNYLLDEKLMVPKNYIKFDNIITKLRFIINEHIILHVIVTNDIINFDSKINKRYKLFNNTYDYNNNYIKCFLHHPGLKYEFNGTIYNISFLSNSINRLIDKIDKIEL